MMNARALANEQELETHEAYRAELAELMYEGVDGIKKNPEDAHRDFWGSTLDEIALVRKEVSVEASKNIGNDFVEVIGQCLHEHFGDTIDLTDVE